MTTGVFQLEGVYATVLGDTDSEGQDARMATWTLAVGPSVRRRVYNPVFPSAMNLHDRVCKRRQVDSRLHVGAKKGGFGSNTMARTCQRLDELQTGENTKTNADRAVQLGAGSAKG